MSGLALLLPLLAAVKVPLLEGGAGVHLAVYGKNQPDNFRLGIGAGAEGLVHVSPLLAFRAHLLRFTFQTGDTTGLLLNLSTGSGVDLLIQARPSRTWTLYPFLGLAIATTSSGGSSSTTLKMRAGGGAQLQASRTAGLYGEAGVVANNVASGGNTVSNYDWLFGLGLRLRPYR